MDGCNCGILNPEPLCAGCRSVLLQKLSDLSGQLKDDGHGRSGALVSGAIDEIRKLARPTSPTVPAPTKD